MILKNLIHKLLKVIKRAEDDAVNTANRNSFFCDTELGRVIHNLVSASFWNKPPRNCEEIED